MVTYNSEEYAEYILNEYRKSIIHLAYTYLQCMNDAQDVAQDVFISLEFI